MSTSTLFLHHKNRSNPWHSNKYYFFIFLKTEKLIFKIRFYWFLASSPIYREFAREKQRVNGIHGILQLRFLHALGACTKWFFCFQTLKRLKRKTFFNLKGCTSRHAYRPGNLVGIRLCGHKGRILKMSNPFYTSVSIFFEHHFRWRWPKWKGWKCF